MIENANWIFLSTTVDLLVFQDPVLRKKFAGKPENVINFFFMLAEEVRAKGTPGWLRCTLSQN